MTPAVRRLLLAAALLAFLLIPLCALPDDRAPTLEFTR